jgi:hypothetical protein
VSGTGWACTGWTPATRRAPKGDMTAGPRWAWGPQRQTPTE